MQCIAYKSLCGGIAIIKKSQIGPQPQEGREKSVLLHSLKANLLSLQCDKGTSIVTVLHICHVCSKYMCFYIQST